MLLIIPMGGLGNRFKEAGYKKPKPLISVLGKPILFWLFDNLDLKNVSKIIVPYQSFLQNYRFEDCLKKKYPNLNFHFIKLNQNTEGAAHTLKISLDALENQEDDNIVSIDCDNFYTTNIIKSYLDGENKNKVFVFDDKSDDNSYSYCEINNKKIISIKEKNKISNFACCGVYGFNSWKNLLLNINEIIENQIKQKNEYYISNVISHMISKNIDFEIHEINYKDFFCLGTPLKVRFFCNNNKTEKKRFCFDLDNTLVTFPKIKDDYSTVGPIDSAINFVRHLKNLGHTIIIYTARRMKTHCGNTGAALKDIGKITFETLDKFNIPYDEIYFGKPLADFYIDDLGVCAYEDIEKELGFYINENDARSFNNIEKVNIDLYRKKSKDLSGEIHYYKNIPQDLKHLFPSAFRFDENNKKWYDMEKINGIPISKLYLSQEFNIELLKNILFNLEKLHDYKFDNDESNIYLNYKEKLISRYQMIDYKKFKNSHKIYKDLLEYFDGYENKSMGSKCIIHGDPVFTNIILDEFQKIKFIDMRGKQGDFLTILGDKFYDLAKVYQSLIGYEEILDQKKISFSYKNEFIEFFENKYQKDIDKIKMIRKLLIFTLMPLHDEKNRHKFWELISII